MITIEEVNLRPAVEAAPESVQDLGSGLESSPTPVATRVAAAVDRVRAGLHKFGYRVGTKLGDWAVQVITAARRSDARIYARTLEVAAAAGVWWRRYRYSGGHHVARSWFGRARSTAEITGYAHRAYRLQRNAARTLTNPPADEEGELPVSDWVGWLERIQEVMRAHDEALHPRTGHRFVCS